MRSAFQPGLFVLAILLITSCAGSESPVSPNPILESIPKIDAPVTGRALWGMWDISIDPSTESISILPFRTIEFQLNAVRFLQPPIAPIHLLTIDLDTLESDLASGRVVCDIAIKHPFPSSQFCGFDVIGIIMDDWEPSELAGDPSIILSLPPSTLLRNPDGWTRWWNESEFTTYGKIFGYTEGAKAIPGWTSTHTLNSYKYFSDDLGALDAFNPSIENRGFFSSVDPGINKRRYEMQFPIGENNSEPVFHFKYAVSASWVAPYPDAEAPYEPSEFPPDANMPEAYRIGLFDAWSTAYYVSESICGGDLHLCIDVYDWQYDGNLSTIPDEIKSVTIESPTLFPDPIQLDLSEAIPNPGNPGGIQVLAHVEDVTPTGLENQYIIVTVESATVTTYEPQIPGISGFDFPDGPLAAYGILPVKISSIAPNQPPVVDAGATAPVWGYAPLDVNLDPSLSYDTDGTIELYEWDFENDGVFDVSTFAPDIVLQTFDEGVHPVNLRVTDDNGATGELDEPLLITSVEKIWNVDVIDEGHFYSNHALAVDSLGRPHVFYSHEMTETLTSAWYDGMDWQIVTSDVGLYCMFGADIDSEDHPHFIYNTHHDLEFRYGHFNGSEWELHEVEDFQIGQCGIAVDSMDRPHISLGALPHDGGAFFYIYHDGYNWIKEVQLEGEISSQSIDIDSNDNPHIVQHQYYNPYTLIHSVKEDGVWEHSDIYHPGTSPHLRIDSSDNLHVAFGEGGYPTGYNILKYGIYSGDEWTFMTIDDSSDFGDYSIAISDEGIVHVSYHDEDTEEVKYAWFDGLGWHHEVVDPDVGSWVYTSIGITSGGVPCIGICDHSNDLIKAAWIE